jgi:hypothetical protein
MVRLPSLPLAKGKNSIKIDVLQLIWICATDWRVLCPEFRLGSGRTKHFRVKPRHASFMTYCFVRNVVVMENGVQVGLHFYSKDGEGGVVGLYEIRSRDG